MKNGNARRVDYPIFGGARDVAFMDNIPWGWIILAKNAGCLLFIYSLAHPEFIASVHYVKPIRD